MDREFIAERQRGLQNYLNVIMANHVLANCELLKKFLDPNNYSANYTGEKWSVWAIVSRGASSARNSICGETCIFVTGQGFFAKTCLGVIVWTFMGGYNLFSKCVWCLCRKTSMETVTLCTCGLPAIFSVDWVDSPQQCIEQPQSGLYLQCVACLVPLEWL